MLSPQTPVKLVLLDDNVTVQKVVSLTLDRSRFEIFYAKNKAEAMKYIHQMNPDMVLMSDQTVSDVDLFIQEIDRTVERKPSMVLLTQNTQMPYRKSFNSVIKKPFNPQIFLEVVEEELQRMAESANAHDKGMNDDPSQPHTTSGSFGSANILEPSDSSEEATLVSIPLRKPQSVSSSSSSRNLNMKHLEESEKTLPGIDKQSVGSSHNYSSSPSQPFSNQKPFRSLEKETLTPMNTIHVKNQMSQGHVNPHVNPMKGFGEGGGLLSQGGGLNEEGGGSEDAVRKMRGEGKYKGEYNSEDVFGQKPHAPTEVRLEDIKKLIEEMVAKKLAQLPLQAMIQKECDAQFPLLCESIIKKKIEELLRNLS